MKYYFIDATVSCKETADNIRVNGIYLLEGPDKIADLLRSRLKEVVLPSYEIHISYHAVNLL